MLQTSEPIIHVFLPHWVAQWASKSGPCISYLLGSTPVPLGEVLEMQILGPHSILTEPEILQYRCVLTSPSDDSTGLSSLKTTGLEEVKIFPKKAMRT